MQTVLPEPVRRMVEDTVRVQSHDLGILDAHAVATEIRDRFPDERVPLAMIVDNVIATAGKCGVAVELG